MKLLRRYKILIVSLLDLFFNSFSYLAALALRFDFDFSQFFLQQRVLIPLSLLLAARYGSYLLFEIHQRSWSFFSSRDLVDVAKAHILSSIVFSASLGALRIPEFPRSVVLIELALSILIVAGIPFVFRLFRENLLLRKSRTANAGRSVAVLGAGNTGQLVVKQLLGSKSANYSVACLLDDNSSLWKQRIHGVVVCGALSSLDRRLKERTDITLVLCAIPSISASRFRELEQICSQRGVLLRAIKGIEELVCETKDAGEEVVGIERLLSKSTNIECEVEIEQELCSKCVLVSGGGGSIGSELVKQILRCAPAKIIILDQSEYSLHRIENQLKQNRFSNCLQLELGDIKDFEQVKGIIDKHSPQFVFHAAAYKHVPFMESSIYQAVRTNVLGTRNVLVAAASSGVQNFVLVSTDKAVKPTSVMGLTKKIAENITLAMHDVETKQGSLQCSIVRFGNVINSSGSVIPLFKKQIMQGGPITVTHPEMTRFFMSTSEAVHLVLVAALLGNKGQVHMLDMGHPIKIVDIAEKMRAMFGRPEIEIKYTGIRKGEKLHEELYLEEERASPTKYSKIYSVEKSRNSINYLKLIDQLEELLSFRDDQKALSFMQEIADFSDLDQELSPVVKGLLKRVSNF